MAPLYNYSFLEAATFDNLIIGLIIILMVTFNLVCGSKWFNGATKQQMLF